MLFARAPIARPGVKEVVQGYEYEGYIYSVQNRLYEADEEGRPR